MSIKCKEDLISALAIASMDSLEILKTAFAEHVEFSRAYLSEAAPESLEAFEKEVKVVADIINLLGWSIQK